MAAQTKDLGQQFLSARFNLIVTASSARGKEISFSKQHLIHYRLVRPQNNVATDSPGENRTAGNGPVAAALSRATGPRLTGRRERTARLERRRRRGPAPGPEPRERSDQLAAHPPDQQHSAMKLRLEPAPLETPRVHPGHDCFFVLEGRVQLLLGDRSPDLNHLAVLTRPGFVRAVPIVPGTTGPACHQLLQPATTGKPWPSLPSTRTNRALRRNRLT